MSHLDLRGAITSYRAAPPPREPGTAQGLEVPELSLAPLSAGCYRGQGAQALRSLVISATRWNDPRGRANRVASRSFGVYSRC